MTDTRTTSELPGKNQAAIDAADKASNYEWGFSSDIEQTFKILNGHPEFLNSGFQSDERSF
jgi:hypothetical protein